MSDRLLNKEERLAIEAGLPGDAPFGAVIQAWLEAQDAKSTLRERQALGARLEALFPHTAHSPRLAKLDEAITAFKKGRRP